MHIKKLAVIIVTALAVTFTGSIKAEDKDKSISAGEQPASTGAQPEMNGKLKVVPMEADDYTFTGKPYDKDFDAYLFACRNYDPQLARWTTPDPMGFPDGANNRMYAPVPTCEFDRFGLFYAGRHYDGDWIDFAAWAYGKANVAGPMTIDSMKHADGTNGGNWTLEDWEIALVKGSSEYTTFKNDVGSALTLAFGGAANGSSGWSTDRTHYDFTSNDDVHSSIGGCYLSTSGTVTVSSGHPHYTATVTLDDTYTFDPYATSSDPYLALGYRLESHDWIYPFGTTGTWDESFE